MRSKRANLTSIDNDISQLQQSLDESVAITRNLSIDLSPAILQGDSMVNTLNWLSNQMHDQYGLNVSMESNCVSTKFEYTLRILLFQAVREALFNVVKHADSLNARLSFEHADDHIHLTISDNGNGFNASQALHDPNRMGGLMNIRHRLSLMGCQMEINSSPKKGTRVSSNSPGQQVK